MKFKESVVFLLENMRTGIRKKDLYQKIANLNESIHLGYENKISDYLINWEKDQMLINIDGYLLLTNKGIRELKAIIELESVNEL